MLLLIGDFPLSLNKARVHKTMSQMTLMLIIYFCLLYKLGVLYDLMTLPILNLLYLVLLFILS